MISSYGTTTTPTPAPTIVITTDYSTARSYRCLIQLYRYLHLVLNVICVAIAGYHTNTCIYPTPGGIFYLLVTVILTVASFALLVWYWLISTRADLIGPKPIHEAVYYFVCCLWLTAAYAAVLAENNPLNYDLMNRAVGIAICNAALYLGSAFLFWKIANRN